MLACNARLCLVVAALAVAVPAAAVQSGATANPQPEQDARKSVQAVRITGAAPSIDGRLTEAIWNSAPAATDFVQRQPRPLAPSAQRTETRIAYDDEAIYVAIRAFDTEPDSIVGRLARRDQMIYSDWVVVAFDSYYDRRTGFAFGLNPRGVKFDLQIYNDTQDDPNWDAIWDAAAVVDSLGWTAEYRIPLSQLRFASATRDAETQTWGLNVMRRIARLQEESFWSPTRPDANRIVSLFGDLTGLKGLAAPRKLEVVPYTVARVTREPGERANPFYRVNAAAASAGGDLKFGVSSNLTLTATINPDFGQVEADPSEVNLTAFETFFPEKRPFFIEGADIFRFGIGAGDGDFGNESLFYSRRIGRAPQASVPGTARYDETPDATTILAAGKLSGRTSSGWSLGVLSALTDAEHARYTTADRMQLRATVEPLTHYGVARAIRDFRGGRSALGVIATAVNRDLPSELAFLRAQAYTSGVSGRHRFLKDRYEISGHLVGTHIRGDSSAISRAQRSSARYFQRPDADHVDFDGGRTSLSGVNFNFAASRVGGGNWNYGVFTTARTPGFEANDLGFMRSADDITAVWWAGYRSYTAGQRLRRWNLGTNQWNSWTFGREHTATGANLNGGLQLLNYWSVHGSVLREQQALSVSALRGGPALLRPGRFNTSIGVNSDERRQLSGNGGLQWTREDESGGSSVRVSAGLTVRPSSSADLRLSPAMSWNRNPWQYVQRSTVAGTDRYVFGDLEQRTASLTARVNYTFTPELSLQFYAQPFISAGSYASFSRVAEPRAQRFGERFVRYDPSLVRANARGNFEIDENADGRPDFTISNPNFNVKELRSNLVARWEYRPGSAFYLVWAHRRRASDTYGRFELARDADELFDAPATNVLLVKFSYWLDL